MADLVLRPPQVPMVDWLIKHRRCNLWAGMGIGKSSAALMALDCLGLMGELDRKHPTLVIGPKRVARDTWPQEVQKWDNFRHFTIVPIMGTLIQRRDALKRKADIYTTNYEQLPWLVEQFNERWPFRQIIADESDRLKGFRTRQGGERARSIGRVAHFLTERWINLTGTPAPNGLKDLWGQNWYIDRGVRLGQSYDAFKKRWFHRAWNGYGIEPMPFAEEQIKERLKDVTLTIDPKDYFDLDDPIVEVIKVRLPPAARKIYRDLEKEMYAELLEGGEVEVFNAAALTSKCLQLANGAVYTQRPKWEAVHDEKIQALESIVNESGGMPLLVAYQFKSDLERLKKAFPGSVELATPAGMKQFMNGHSPMGLAHPKSMGHGIDGLQYITNILVRFGHDWNLGDRLQMLERIGPMRQLQASLDRPMFIYDIIAEGTVDEQVLERHVTKRRVQDLLLEAMKHEQSRPC